MMFKNKFVVCIKVGNKILREFKDIVKLPFGTEFTILLKNLNTVRAQVSVFIDGTDVTDGVHLVVDPNTEFELTRFIKNSNLKSGNCFKFIEMTEGIEKHRGVKTEDGLVRVEFQFERPMATITTTTNDNFNEKLEAMKKEMDKKADKSDTWPWRYPVYPTPYYYPYVPPTPYCPPYRWTTQPNTICGSGGTSLAGQTMTAGIAGLPQNGGVTSQSFINNCDRSVEVSCCNVSVGEFSIADSASINDAGITVPGSESNQKFSMVSSFYTEDEKHVIVLKLVGVTERGVQYVAPVTVQAKPTCQTCGRVNKATSKFCSECGTSLVIL